VYSMERQVSNRGAIRGRCAVRSVGTSNSGKNRTAHRTGADVDAALAAAAQGVEPTSDDANALPDGEDRRETDVIGKAAGVVIADGKPIGGPDEIDRRDAHRWELDPSSADEPADGKETSVKSPATRPRRRSRPSSGER